MDSILSEGLLWFFLGTASSVLRVWISILFRAQRSSGSRLMLLASIIELPASLVSNTFWYIWPFGIFSGSGWANYDPFSTDTLQYKVSEIASYVSGLALLLWLVGILLVALRYKQDLRRTRELQQVLESSIGSGDPPATP
ncbi:hypothetical protein HAHE_39690 [Haloferula helveola]|uniref:Uncharacterized protein n=1 Tax=Haloferula helveola TaxID=490095 RepID=A0ABM7REA7_9BACT|nr:hypothetical protein HAHE_39690 [Haloferula helveola]